MFFVLDFFLPAYILRFIYLHRCILQKISKKSFHSNMDRKNICFKSKSQINRGLGHGTGSIVSATHRTVETFTKFFSSYLSIGQKSDILAVKGTIRDGNRLSVTTFPLESFLRWLSSNLASLIKIPPSSMQWWFILIAFTIPVKSLTN